MKDDRNILTDDDLEEMGQHGRWITGCILVFFGLFAIGVLLEGC